MLFLSGIFDEFGNGITGSTDLHIKIMRESDLKFWCFSHNTFESVPHSDYGILVDLNTSVVPGFYIYSLNVSSWQDGSYTAFFNYTGNYPWTSAEEFIVSGGKASDIIAGESLKFILKWILNRLVISGDTMTLYDDDNTTVLKRWTLSQGDINIPGPYNRSKAT